MSEDGYSSDDDVTINFDGTSLGSESERLQEQQDRESSDGSSKPPLHTPGSRQVHSHADDTKPRKNLSRLESAGKRNSEQRNDGTVPERDPIDHHRVSECGNTSQDGDKVIGEDYKFNETLLKETCTSFHGILSDDIVAGKRELLKDRQFLQGRLYDVMTYVMAQKGLSLNQVLLEYSHSKLQYKRYGRIPVRPKVDIALCRHVPGNKVKIITAIMINKTCAGYEPDVRSLRLDMIRLAYLIRERGCSWGFYIFLGQAEELQWLDIRKATHRERINETYTDVLLKRDVALLPNIRKGASLPATYTKTVILNCTGDEFCVRLYRIEAGNRLWNEHQDDLTRLLFLKQSYFTTDRRQPVDTSATVKLEEVRQMLIKTREFLQAKLENSARSTFSAAKHLWGEIRSHAQLSDEQKMEIEYMKEHLKFLHGWLQEEALEPPENDSHSKLVDFMFYCT
ncbi:uncharacterized protein [Ptychodera flava]|uniref:uncharacterized protein n=1 Tax=Ptychodera flava TaxID=63121 RepID=UPI003969FE24